MANTKIQSEQIQDGAITAAKIADGAIVAAEVADNAITTAKINADAVTGAKIADDAINSEHYTDGSIDTAHIADANITTAKIADGAITTAKITDANVTTAKIADDAVTSAKIDTNIDIAGTFDVTGATTLDSTLQVDGAITSSDGATITVNDNSIALSLISTDADAHEGPGLVLYRNSSSPADNDANGQIYMQGENDADQKVTYSLIEGFIDDASDGTEDGILRFSSMVSGTSRNRMDIIPAATVFNEDSVDVDFRIESNGNANTFFVNGGKDYVSIGTASDFAAGASVLHLHQPDATSNAYLHITQEDGGATASDGMSIGMLDGGANAVVRLRENGYLAFYTNNTNHMTLQADGKLAVTEISHINGSSGNLEIGNGDEKHIMHSGGYHQFQVADTEIARINSEGIAFNGDSAAANSLDDYEEGTWNPTLISGGSTNPTGGGYTAVQGNYIKIGRQVFVSFYVGRTWTNSPNGQVIVNGLPFTVTDNNDNIAHVPIVTYNMDGAGVTFCAPSLGNSYLLIYQQGSGAWAAQDWQSHATSPIYLAGQLSYFV